MRLQYIVVGTVLLMPSTGCRDDRSRQAIADEAIAKALGSAVPKEVLDQAMNAEALGSAIAKKAAAIVTGKMSSVGGELGTWDVALTECTSGEASGFFGVDFRIAGSDDLRLRYVHDEARGDIVKISNPAKPESFLVPDRANCAVLEGAVEKTHITTWTPKGKIRHLDGHVTFDCKVSDGAGHVTGEATFSNCH